MVKEYNKKQKRPERKIKDYFEHVANLDQDMAVEIIFQCGDKKFWEEHADNREKMYHVFQYLLTKLQQKLPDFKVANAVIHFDEASPHMHVVGVPVWEGAKRGMPKKVSKRNVFTPETLSVILQDKLREEANSCFKFNIKEELAEKSLGRNYDLSVTEYKVAKETEHLEELQKEIHTSDIDLIATKAVIRQMNRKQERKMETVEDELRDKNATISKLDYEIAVKQSRLAECEDNISKLEQFRESLEKLKSYISSYLPLSPLIEEYSNTVERGENIEAGNSFRGLLNAIGELLKSFKELIIDGLCWFPRLMRWNTSKGEVVPVFSDYHNEGYNYRLVGYRNLETKEQYSVESIQGEIKAENRIGTLEQMKERMLSVDSLLLEVDKINVFKR